jgi:hypothetical protein
MKTKFEQRYKLPPKLMEVAREVFGGDDPTLLNEFERETKLQQFIEIVLSNPDKF